MRVAVYGLWHLGTVTAACLAEAGHTVIGIDPDAATVTQLREGQPPVHEPGLDALVARGIASDSLRFTTDLSAVEECVVVWVTFDTPVDEDDRADVTFVTDAIQGLFPHLDAGTLVLISSQLPVGTTRQLEAAYAVGDFAADVRFAVSPENLRLGKALDVFMNPDRVVAGVRSEDDLARVRELLAPITDRIEAMDVESAEMTKHALNAFLATSVTFINEIAALCEQVGADAKAVERGLKTEKRIGPGAYLGPGGAFAGGTLARDIQFLGSLAQQHHLTTPLLRAVPQSNSDHKLWAVRYLERRYGSLAGRRVALWGLAYKRGTDTLRRSLAVELAQALHARGAMVVGHDPLVKALPSELAGVFVLADTPVAALAGADALIVVNGSDPVYREKVAASEFVKAMATPLVLDANRALADVLANAPQIDYVSVGVVM